MRPYLKNNQSKMDWWHGLSSRVPALQAKALSSNSSPTKKKKKGEITVLGLGCKMLENFFLLSKYLSWRSDVTTLILRK
jgi:hypothetical protein